MPDGPIATAASALPSSCRSGRPTRQRGKKLSTSSSGGTPSDHRCGRQQSAAPSSPERRGWTFTVQAVAQARAIDIRTLDRHPLASVGSLVLGLRCSWCPGNAPMPVSPGCTRCRRPRGGAKVCQWNSCTAALSAQRTLKGSAWRLSLSTTSMSSMTKYAVSWLATGLTCWRNFRRTKTDGEKDAVGIADAIGRPRQMTIINESGLYHLVKEADGECAFHRSPCPHPSLSYVGPANTSAQPWK